MGTEDRAWMPPAPRANGPEPEALEGFTELREVARGGDSIVYRARQLSPERDVAIKVLLVEDPDAARRFERELAITLRLGREHPNIVTVLAVGTARSGRPALVMDFVEQGSLHDRLATHGPLPAAVVAAVGTVLADALAFAHARGVLHRDVKPQNVLQLPTSYVLTDFGVARLADSEHTASAERFSYRHASPQVLDGQPPTALDDLWSVGSTLFTLLEGRPPFASDEPGDDTALAYLRRARTEAPRAMQRTDVPEQLRAVIERCLEKDPQARYPDAASLRDALAEVPTENRSWDPEAPPAVRPAPASAPTTTPDLSPQPATEPTAPAPIQLPPTVSTGSTGSTGSTEPDPAPVTAMAATPPGVVEPAAAATIERDQTTATTEADPVGEPAAPAAAESVWSPEAGPATAGPATPVAAPALAVSATALPAEDAAPTGMVPPQPVPEELNRLLGTEEKPAAPRRRRAVFLAVAVLGGAVLGGGGYLVSRLNEPAAKPPAQAKQSGAPVPSASVIPEQTGAVITDPKLSPSIDDLRWKDGQVRLAWTDPSGGRANFVIVRTDEADRGNLVGQTPPGVKTATLADWGKASDRPCFAVLAIMADARASSKPRCLSR